MTYNITPITLYLLAATTTTMDKMGIAFKSVESLAHL